jgi:hypothetical protein
MTISDKLRNLSCHLPDKGAAGSPAIDIAAEVILALVGTHPVVVKEIVSHIEPPLL